jgi:hypothetical protein
MGIETWSANQVISMPVLIVTGRHFSGIQEIPAMGRESRIARYISLYVSSLQNGNSPAAAGNDVRVSGSISHFFHTHDLKRLAIPLRSN